MPTQDKSRINTKTDAGKTSYHEMKKDKICGHRFILALGKVFFYKASKMFNNLNKVTQYELVAPKD